MLESLQGRSHQEWNFLYKTLCVEIIIILCCIILRKKIYSCPHHWIHKSLLLVEWSFLTFSEVIFHSHAQSSTFLTLLFINGLLYYVIEDFPNECETKKTTLHKEHNYNRPTDMNRDDLKHFLLGSLKDGCLEVPRACIVTLSTLPFIHYLSYLFFESKLHYDPLDCYSTQSASYFWISFVFEFSGVILMAIYCNETKLPKIPTQTLASFMKMASFSVLFVFGISAETIHLNPYSPIIVIFTNKCSTFLSEFFKHSFPSFFGFLIASLLKKYNFSIFDYGELNLNMCNNKNYRNYEYDREPHPTSSRHRRYESHHKHDYRHKPKQSESYFYRKNSRPSSEEPHYSRRSAIDSRMNFEKDNYSKNNDEKRRNHHKRSCKTKLPSSESDECAKNYRSRKTYFRATPRSPSPCSYHGLSSSAERIVSFRELEPFEYKKGSPKQTKRSKSPSRSCFIRSTSPNSAPKNSQDYHREKNIKGYNVDSNQNHCHSKIEKIEREYGKMRKRDLVDQYLCQKRYDCKSERDERKHEKAKYSDKDHSHKLRSPDDYRAKCALDPNVLKNNRILVPPQDPRSPFGKYGVYDEEEHRYSYSRTSPGRYDSCGRRRRSDRKEDHMKYDRHRDHSRRQSSLSRESPDGTKFIDQCREYGLYEASKNYKREKKSYGDKNDYLYYSNPKINDFYNKKCLYDKDFKPEFSQVQAHYAQGKSVTSATTENKTSSKISAADKNQKASSASNRSQQNDQQPCGCPRFVTNAENDDFVERMRLNEVKCQMCEFYACTCVRECV